ELQRKLEERTGQMLGKMQRAIDERREKDKEMADALKESLDKGQQGGVKEKMKNAGQDIHDNKLGRATAGQKDSIQTLDNMVQALDERREKELDQLRKKLKEADDKLNELAQRQSELRKKVKEAQQIADPKKKEQELKRLAREQEKLRKETQEMV